MRRSALILSAALVVGALAPGPGLSVSAAPLNGRILFNHCDDAHGCQIYTANPDGSAIRRVTSGGDSFLADWSPDGTQIAYVGTRSGDMAIWIVNADGSHPRQLTPNDPASDNLWPRFMPSGRRILFINCLGADCDGGIRSVRTDGTHDRPVTPNSGESYNLADPSTGGGRMAYMRWSVDGIKMAIYVARADGTQEQRVSPPRLEGWVPDWSPTGGRILFTSAIFFNRPKASLYSVRPDGHGLSALTHPPFPNADWAGSYSPDGTKILFDSDRRYADLCCGDLFTIDAGGGNMQRIHLPYDAYDPRWGPAPLLPATAQTNGPVLGSPGGSPCTNVAELAGTPMCPPADTSS